MIHLAFIHFSLLQKCLYALIPTHAHTHIHHALHGHTHSHTHIHTHTRAHTTHSPTHTHTHAGTHTRTQTHTQLYTFSTTEHLARAEVACMHGDGLHGCDFYTGGVSCRWKVLGIRSAHANRKTQAILA